MKVFMLTVLLLVGAVCASPQGGKPPGGKPPGGKPPSGGPPSGGPPNGPPPCFKANMTACMCPSTVDAATCQATKNSVKDALKVCFGTLLDAQADSDDLLCNSPPSTTTLPPPPAFLPSPSKLVQCIAANTTQTLFKDCIGKVWPAYASS